MRRDSQSLSSATSRRAACLAVAGATLALACGSERSDPPAPPPRVPPFIVEQPVPAAVFEGQTALFQVRAAGGALTYQWSRDGVDVPGATDSHYVTARTASGDDGAVYRVAVVANGSTPTLSAAARLQVLPPLDLRFQLVGAPLTLSYRQMTDLLFGWAHTMRAVGAPLLVGDGTCAAPPPGGNCAWIIAGASGLRGYSTTYHATSLDAFGASWVAGLAPGALVTSLDLEEVAGAFATSVLESTQVGTFTPRVGSTPLDQLAAVAAAEGAEGRVITAASFQGGQVTWISYAWSEAPGARFETAVSTSTIAAAGAAAAELGARGYVITALGAGNNGANGVVMVGTRREGVTAPRDVQAIPIGAVALLPIPSGYAVVGYLFDHAAVKWTMICQR